MTGKCLNQWYDLKRWGMGVKVVSWERADFRGQECKSGIFLVFIPAIAERKCPISSAGKVLSCRREDPSSNPTDNTKLLSIQLDYFYPKFNIRQYTNKMVHVWIYLLPLVPPLSLYSL